MMEVVLITVSCVLFIQMGLYDAIRNTLNIQSRIVSCPRCLTFWSVFLFSVFSKSGFLVSVATSFIASYSALWLALLYDVLAAKYNSIYDKITKTTDTSDDAQAGNRHPYKKARRHQVSSM